MKTPRSKVESIWVYKRSPCRDFAAYVKIEGFPDTLFMAARNPNQLPFPGNAHVFHYFPNKVVASYE